MKRFNKPNFKMPKLRLLYRIMLYISMVVFSALAIINVVFEKFSFAAGIAVYVLAACTLFLSVYYLVLDFRYGIRETVKPAVAANPYVNMVSSDYRLRTVLFAVPGMLSNIMFALFNAIIGIISRSAWFGSLAAYYILLSIMRMLAVRQERKISKINDENEKFKRELSVYRKSSFLFMLLAIVLVGMVILLEASQGGMNYPGVTIYVAALYAFYKIIMSSINVVKVKKRKSPLLTAIKRIGYIDACVSILTLQTAMFASFAEGQDMFIKIMNGATGSVVCLMILFLGIQGIYSSYKMGLTEGESND